MTSDFPSEDLERFAMVKGRIPRFLRFLLRSSMTEGEPDSNKDMGYQQIERLNFQRFRSGDSSCYFPLFTLC